MPWNTSGPFTTIKAKSTLNWRTVFSGSAFIGPIVVVPNIYASNDEYGDNFGTLSVADLSVSATAGNASEPDALWPVSFAYHYTITNNDSNPIVFNVAIGTF
jgi:hypothetical protein